MKLPQLNILPTNREVTDVFYGYNHNYRIGNGEFYDMKNMTSDYYPILSPRTKRGVYTIKGEDGVEQPVTNARGLIEKDALCYVKDGQFFINGYPVNLENITLSDEPKTMVSMGAYVIIMPDKVYINTADHSDHGKIEATFTTKDGEADTDFYLCKLDGADYDKTTTSAVEPSPSSDGVYPMWLDTSSKPYVLKQYSTSSKEWVSVPTTYIKIASTGIGASFKEGDGVTISGITAEGLTDLNNTMIVWARDDDYIVVTGMLGSQTSQPYRDKDGKEHPIKVERLMPKMDFIIESENRLWGCRYGEDINGNVVNEIYASKLGDFRNWRCYAGISTDSYAATVGTDGVFTGAITHMGYPLFFKENYMHKVYGNYPANYQIQTTACRGVQRGCGKSLAIVNETLFYKSPKAVCAYDGSLPAEISSQLGEEQYSNAVAGSIGNKYYISMADRAGIYHLFAYDSSKGMWHKEDNTKVIEFCRCDGDLYYIASDNTIKTILGSGTKDTAPVSWMAETGVIGTDSPGKKYISRIVARLSLDLNTRVMIFIQYDSMGSWEHLYTMTGTSLRSFSVPIRPKRCDHLRLRFEGVGDAKIFSIYKTIEQGSDA